jgi:hypothetical protein
MFKKYKPQPALPTFVSGKTGQKNIKGGTKGYFD